MTDKPTNKNSPGWGAIDAALARLYPNKRPKHYGTTRSWQLGGEPLDGISVYKRTDPVPHWHFVTYGLTELYTKESENKEISGSGAELTFRVACSPTSEEPPKWAIDFLQNIARYVLETGNQLNEGHWMSANGPISLDTDTKLVSVGFMFDPELPKINTPNGQVAFLQVIGLTIDEELAAKRWNARALLTAMLPYMPLWITDLNRLSLLTHTDLRKKVDEGTLRDGSTCGSLFIDELKWKVNKRILQAASFEVTIGARQINEITEILPLRLLFSRELILLSDNGDMRFVRGQNNSVISEKTVLTFTLTDTTVKALVHKLQPHRGTYVVEGLNQVTWRIEPTVIKGKNGKIVQTIG
jgi:hypothetical protein